MIDTARDAGDAGPAAGSALGAAFWLTHLWIPGAAGVVMLALFSTTLLDLRLAQVFFDFASGHWWGARTWWAEDLLHEGGRNVVRMLTAAAILGWWFGRRRPAWREAAQLAGYCALSIILTVVIAGALKSVTNVDCPWDLAAFNGTRPYVHVFGDRPDALPTSRCFPGAHSSSGFALLCLYFAFRERSRRLARAGLALGLCVGGAFSFAQQARGAHFLSHDLTSAFLAWFVALGVYVRYRASAFTAFAPRRYRTIPSCPAPGRAGTNAGAVPPSRG